MFLIIIIVDDAGAEMMILDDNPDESATVLTAHELAWACACEAWFNLGILQYNVDPG